MKKLLPGISGLGLALVLIPACFYLAGSAGKPQMQTLMSIGTVVWFITAPLWMGNNSE